jgi:hypothetical protein
MSGNRTNDSSNASSSELPSTSTFINGTASASSANTNPANNGIAVASNTGRSANATAVANLNAVAAQAAVTASTVTDKAASPASSNEKCTLLGKGIPVTVQSGGAPHLAFVFSDEADIVAIKQAIANKGDVASSSSSPVTETCTILLNGVPVTVTSDGKEHLALVFSGEYIGIARQIYDNSKQGTPQVTPQGGRRTRRVKSHHVKTRHVMSRHVKTRRAKSRSAKSRR